MRQPALLALQQSAIALAMRFGRDLQAPKFSLPQLRLADTLQHLCHIHARPPGTLGIEPHQLRHMLTISRDHAAGEITAGTLRHHSAARIDGDAGGEALEVPFERRRQRLVEIGDVENGCAIRAPNRCRNSPDGSRRRTAPRCRWSAWSQGPPPSPQPNRAGRRTAIASCGHSGSAAATRSDAGWSRSACPPDRAGRKAAARSRANCAAPTDEGHGLPHVAPSSGADRRVGHSRVACFFPDFVTITPQSGMPAQAEFVI